MRTTSPQPANSFFSGQAGHACASFMEQQRRPQGSNNCCCEHGRRHWLIRSSINSDSLFIFSCAPFARPSVEVRFHIIEHSFRPIHSVRLATDCLQAAIQTFIAPGPVEGRRALLECRLSQVHHLVHLWTVQNATFPHHLERHFDRVYKPLGVMRRQRCMVGCADILHGHECSVRAGCRTALLVS